jgi:hypothetical protein
MDKQGRFSVGVAVSDGAIPHFLRIPLWLDTKVGKRTLTLAKGVDLIQERQTN